MDVLEIETREELETWFKERPPAVAQVVAARAALRSLPYMVRAKNVENFEKDILLPVFWAVTTSWVARKYPTHNVSTSSSAASAASAAIHLEAVGTSESAAATAVLNASVAASHAAASSTTAAFAVEAVFFANRAADPAYFVDALSNVALWKESLQDCAFLEDALKHNVKAENAARDLVGQRLWREQKMPRDTHERWNELQDFLSNAGDNWEVWDSWYYTRIEGIKTIEVTSDLMEKADVGIATLDEKLWTQGPAVVNAEIKRLMDGGARATKFDDAAKHQVLGEMKSRIDNLYEDYVHKFSDHMEKTSGAQEEVFTKKLNELLQKHLALIVTKTNEAAEIGAKSIRDTAENALTGVRAEKVFQDSFTLWEKKKASHRRNFWCGAVLFLFLIVACGITGWRNFDVIKNLITEVAPSDKATGSEISDTALLFSRFLIVTLPVAIVVWILRAILRFANLNLSLAEDAAQREVMAQTYVNLLATGQLTEKEDRQLMLSALFRPLPGIQEIDAAPTTIIDISNPTKAKK